MSSSLRLGSVRARAGIALGGALPALLLTVTGLPACGPEPEMLPAEYARITYSIDMPPGSGTMGKPLVLPIVAGTVCERAAQQIKVFFSGSNAGIQFTLKGNGTAPYQASLGASVLSQGTARVDLSLPLSFEGSTGRMPITFTTTSSGDDLTCTIGLNVADPFSDFSGDLTCESGSNAMMRKLMLSGTFKAVPCPMQ
jgi:hypothetical protein